MAFCTVNPANCHTHTHTHARTHARTHAQLVFTDFSLKMQQEVSLLHNIYVCMTLPLKISWMDTRPPSHLQLVFKESFHLLDFGVLAKSDCLVFIASDIILLLWQFKKKKLSLKRGLNMHPLVPEQALWWKLQFLRMRCCGCSFKLLYNNKTSVSELMLIIFLHQFYF